MTITILEAPRTKDEVKRDSAYMRRAISDVVQRKEVPLITMPNAEFAKMAKKIAVYNDYGLTPEMQQAMVIYGRLNLPIEYRKIGKNIDGPISIVCFKWNKEGYRTKFTADHVNRFFRMIDKHTTLPHRKICITDDPVGIDSHIETLPLWDNPCPRYGSNTRPNCFYRLRMFEPDMEKELGSNFVWFDLDAVITANIDHLLMDGSDLKMWRVDNESMPCNGSLLLHRTGTRKELWYDFNPQTVHPASGLQHTGKIGSDQAFIANKLTEAEKQNVFGQKDGVYSWRCHIKKRTNRDLPENCCLVFFHGNDCPWHSEVSNNTPWVREHYMEV